MDDKIYKIGFVCSRLDLPGGIERAIVNTANLFSSKGNQVTIIVADELDKSFYPLHNEIKRIHLPSNFGMNNKESWLKRKSTFVRDIASLRRIINELRLDVLITTEYPFTVAAVLAGMAKHTALISWEHFHYNELERSRMWQQLVRFGYSRLNTVVCLNKDEESLFKRLNKSCAVIPNFIDSKSVAQKETRRKRILTIAHLSARKKGFDLFPDIAIKVLAGCPDWEWKVIGTGEMKEHLLQAINANSLEGRLILQEPVSPNLEKEYEEASVFVLTSRFECFPMTLLEAMRNGLPCVAFDCETGPRAIIQHDVNGLLIEKENAALFSDALIELLQNEGKRNEMGLQAMKTVAAFSPEKIYEEWIKVFNTSMS